VQGITAYSCHVPHYRLTHDKIRQALGAGPAKGSRSVASFDEDTTSMAVEAALPTVRKPDLGGAAWAGRERLERVQRVRGPAETGPDGSSMAERGALR
jgi:hypothetical protein